jgi:hypothetical protein
VTRRAHPSDASHQSSSHHAQRSILPSTHPARPSPGTIDQDRHDRATPQRSRPSTAHVTASVGWLGAVATFLAVAIAGLTSVDVQVARAAYLAMELMGWNVIVPLGAASLVTGLVQSLGTPWRCSGTGESASRPC